METLITEKIIKLLEHQEQKEVNVNDLIFQISLYKSEEKQQLILAHSHGISSHANYGLKINASEDYYKKTFNQV